MGELVVALAPVVLLALVSLVASYVPVAYLAASSLVLVGLGSLFGLPCGIWYHVVLRRELLVRGDLPRGWLWQPTHQHQRLDDAARARVRRWFVLGGAGFLLIVSGALLGVLALALWYRAGGAG
ncbi:MAG TPA: hypothetical protein VFX59_22980 [Polyangiales bacterium]|nr:hypothetical protein [Polyangiales bacterium]